MDKNVALSVSAPYSILNDTFFDIEILNELFFEIRNTLYV